MSNKASSVFVVHGRNEAIRTSMFDFLKSINLEPIDWDEAVSMTGHGSPFTGEVIDKALKQAQAVVVLLTPDEVTYLRSEYSNGPLDKEAEPSPQARPNVIFEAGMAFGFAPETTILVEFGSIRNFTDIAGRNVIRMDNSEGSRRSLASRLETAGCPVDLSGVEWLTIGDFTPPLLPGGGLPLGKRVPSKVYVRPAVEFDVEHIRASGTGVDKLRIINRGSETAYDVMVTLPENAALSLQNWTSFPLKKIPGNGKSVTISVFNQNRTFGGSLADSTFDVTVSGRTESYEHFEQTIFLDVNG